MGRTHLCGGAISSALSLLILRQRSVWANVIVDSPPAHWATQILLLVGVVSLLTSILLLVWFHLLPRIRRGRGANQLPGETSREDITAKRLILMFLLISALTIPASMMPPPVHPEMVFDSENLTMKVLPDLTGYQMTGYYLIVNPSRRHVPARLLVPFPSTSWRATSIELNGTHRTLVKTEEGYEISYRFDPLEALRIEVSGLRRIQAMENGTRLLRYDITTTRRWRYSIREATFQVILPAQSKVLDVHPGNWTSESTQEGLEIRILERSFMPDGRELTVRFHPPNQATMPDV